MKYHFFTDVDAIQAGQDQNMAFGPQTDGVSYNLETVFNLTQGAPAYAICRSVFLVAEQEDPSLLNAVLYPLEQESAGLPLRFIIYRGLDRQSLLDSNDALLLENPPDDHVLKVIKEIQDEINAANQEENPEATEIEVDKSALGLVTPQIPESTMIEALCLEHPSDFQPIIVPRGCKIGSFLGGTTHGSIELILDSIGQEPEYSLLKSADHIFAPTLLDESEGQAPDVLLKNKFVNRTRKEAVLSYVDITAFYGSCKNQGIRIGGENVGQGNESTFLQGFYNKDAVYIDIRDNRGFSFDHFFSENSPLQLGWHQQASSELIFSDSQYYEDWPILILKGQSFPTNKRFFYLKFPLGRGIPIEADILTSFSEKVSYGRSKKSRRHIDLNELAGSGSDDSGISSPVRFKNWRFGSSESLGANIFLLKKSRLKKRDSSSVLDYCWSDFFSLDIRPVFDIQGIPDGEFRIKTYPTIFSPLQSSGQGDDLFFPAVGVAIDKGSLTYFSSYGERISFGSARRHNLVHKTLTTGKYSFAIDNELFDYSQVQNGTVGFLNQLYQLPEGAGIHVVGLEEIDGDGNQTGKKFIIQRNAKQRSRVKGKLFDFRAVSISRAEYDEIVNSQISSSDNSWITEHPRFLTGEASSSDWFGAISVQDHEFGFSLPKVSLVDETASIDLREFDVLSDENGDPVAGLTTDTHDEGSLSVSMAALATNPLILSQIDKDQLSSGKLLSSLLAPDEYLRALAFDDNTTPKLSSSSYPKDSYVGIVRLKAALTLIDHYALNEYDVPSGQFIPSEFNGEFSQKMEAAVSELQTQAMQANSELQFDSLGVIDSKTLLFIDRILAPQESYFIYKEELSDFAGDSTQVMELAAGIRSSREWNVESSVPVGDGFQFDLFVQKVDGGTEAIQVHTTSGPLVAKPNYPVVATAPFFQDAILLDLSASNNLVVSGGSSLEEELSVVRVNAEGLKLFDYPGDIGVDESSINFEASRTPPQYLPAPFSRLHHVDNSDLHQLLLDEYYGGELEFGQDHSQNPIHTFPARNPLPVEQRHLDARYQFYINFIYYLNIEYDSSGAPIEYGIRKGSDYELMPLEALDDYKLYENPLDSNDTRSPWNNYLRFLEYQKNETSGACQLVFDSQGETNSIVLQPGENIYLPSREFMEVLFYNLNARPELLLDEQGDYREESEYLALVEESITWVTETFDEFKEDLRNVNLEILQYFKDIWDFISSDIEDIWPRSLGSFVDLGIGATAYSVMLNGNGQFYVWRKMSSKNEMIIAVKERLRAEIGGDVGVGLSTKASPGGRMGKGRRRPLLGLDFGASEQISGSGDLLATYEYPVTKEDISVTAQVGLFLGTYSGQAASQVMSLVAQPFGQMLKVLISAFFVTGIDPRQYITQLTPEIALNYRVWVSAHRSSIWKSDEDGSELDTKLLNSSKDPNVDDYAGHADVNHVWSSVPGAAGLGVEGGASIGYEWGYTASYDANSYDPVKEARVPSKVEVKSMFFARGHIQAARIGQWIESWLGNQVGDFLASLLSTDNGITVGAVHTWERPAEVSAKNMTIDHILWDEDENQPDLCTDYISNPDHQDGDSLQSGRIKYLSSGWSSQLVIGLQTGDIDEPCGRGQEQLLRLDTCKIYQLIGLGNTSEEDFYSNPVSVIDIFHSLRIDYKIGWMAEGAVFKRLNDALFRRLVKDLGKMSGIGSDDKRAEVKNVLENLIKAKEQPTKFVDTGMAAAIGLEFDLKSILLVLKYHLRRLNMLYQVATGVSFEESQKFVSELDQDVGNIESELGTLKNKAYYIELYTQLNSLLDEVEQNGYGGYSFVSGLSHLWETQRLLSLVKYIAGYLEGVLFSEDKSAYNVFDLLEDKLGWRAILEAFAYAAALGEIDIKLEAKVGAGLSQGASASGGIKFRLGLSAAAGFLMDWAILEGGISTIQEDEEDAFSDIQASLLSLLDSREDGTYTDLRESILQLDP